MPLKSDLQIDAGRFQSKAISEKTHKFNDGLIEIRKRNPKWWEVGAAKFREMRWNGETPLPKPVVLESGKNMKVPSREHGREIPCRFFEPEKGKPKGVFYHIHGGGWVLQTEHYYDLMLKKVADDCQAVVLSVGYRLAPEDPYPAGNEDCFDVGEYLVDHAEEKWGAPLKFMMGDSAGGHLSSLTCFHLLQTRPGFAFEGLVLNFGAYDLSGYLPQMWTFDLPLVLDVEIMQKYIEAYLPGKSQGERRDMWISPFFADLTKMKLPPALFTCGTLDCLLDDSVMMATKWQMSGAECILKVYPGAPHGFVFFPPDSTETVQDCWDDIETFINDRL